VVRNGAARRGSMLDPIFIAAYVVASLAVALLGYNRRIGVLGFFILSLLVTPPLILLILIVTRPKPHHHHVPPPRAKT
jgi:hypothetical protein